MKWPLKALLKFLSTMKTNTTSKFARRHHTVQQSYLAHFTPTGKVGGVLYAHDLERLNSWASSTAGVAFQKDFYRVDLPGIAPDIVEKEFSPFEALAATVLKGILKEKRIPSNAYTLRASQNTHMRTFIRLLSKCRKTRRCSQSAELVIANS
jgi:hypothetical protein